MPVAYAVKTAGQDAGSAKTTTVEINPAVDAKMFEKPGK